MKRRKEDIDEDKRVFLLALSEHGTIVRACELAHITRRTYDRWVDADPGFSKEVDTHRVVFAENLENIALERVRNPEKGQGSDMLLTVLLNANNPNKFRPVAALNEESAKDLIIEWRKAAKDMRKEGSVEEVGSGIPESMEKTLVEIMEKRSNAPEESEELEE